MNKTLRLATVGEAAIGVALLIIPSLVSRLLLGVELTGVSVPIAHVAGIALIGLVMGCWPGSTALVGMLTYSGLVTLYLVYLGICGEWVGLLLWPAVAVHAILTILLVFAWFKERKSPKANM